MSTHLHTSIELCRADVDQVLRMIEGIGDELVETLGILISLRPAGVDELLLISGATDSVQEVLARVDAVKTRLANHSSRLELHQEEARALHIAAYGAPAEVAA